MKILCNECSCFVEEEILQKEMKKYNVTNGRDLVSALREEQKEIFCKKCNEEIKKLFNNL